MKAFFEDYSGLEKLAPLVREIGWSHNILIMERCRDPLEQEFYIRMTRKFGWSKTGAHGTDSGLLAGHGRHVRFHGKPI